MSREGGWDTSHLTLPSPSWPVAPALPILKSRFSLCMVIVGPTTSLPLWWGGNSPPAPSSTYNPGGVGFFDLSVSELGTQKRVKFVETCTKMECSIFFQFFCIFIALQILSGHLSIADLGCGTQSKVESASRRFQAKSFSSFLDHPSSAIQESPKPCGWWVGG